MLKKKNIVKFRRDFRELKEKGRLYQSPFFGLVVLKKEDSNISRFAFIISRKISKKAVVRNKIRRLLAESVRINLEKIKKGYDFLFLVKKDMVGLKFDEVKKEVDKVLKKNNFI